MAVKPTVKLTDHRGRTLCAFVWTEDTEEPRWKIDGKPQGRKGQRRSTARMAEHGVDFPIPHAGDRPDIWRDDHPVRLEVPGLTLRWDTVTAVLDVLAEQFGGADLTLTVDQFRRCVN